MEDNQKVIRFGVMVDGDIVERWQLDTVNMLTDNGMTLALVIQNADESKPYSSFADKLKRYPYSRLLFRLWNRYFFKPDAKTRVAASFKQSQSGEKIQFIKCLPIMRGISSYLSDSDIATIRSYDLDFILRFGFDIIRGDVLKAARYGIWSFHHDDERVFRGGPPGFWEFMRKIPTNGVILQQLTDELDKGLILKRMQLDTQLHSYKYHLNRLLETSTVMPLQMAQQLKIDGKLEPEQSQSQAPIQHPPRNFQMLRYFWLCFWRKIVFHYKYFFRQEDWNVGYSEMPVSRFISMDEKLSNHSGNLAIHWLKPPKGDYFADSFVLTTANDTYLFFEWFSNKKGKADLTIAKKSEDFKVYHKISDFAEHRSYPYVFEHQGEIYCMPEANHTGKVTLYKFVDKIANGLGASLQADSVLLEGNFVDSTLYHDDGHWYLFTTPQKEPHTHLMLFVSDDLRGPYRPHPANPIKVDCRSSRPAGKLIKMGDELLRPAQNSTHHYGESITLNKIIKLNEYQYIEKEVKEIKPLHESVYDKGIHTLNGDDTITVFDVKKFTFTWEGVRQQFKQKFRP